MASQPTPLGWSDHRTRTVALDGWLAREQAVVAGVVAPLDPVLLGLADRETLLRALFQRWTTTLEGALDVELELGGPAGGAATAAVRSAYRRAARHRPADWRALHREAGDPVVAELTRRQHARLARRAGLAPLEVAAIAAQTAEVASTPMLSRTPRPRRRPGVVRVLDRRAG